MIYNYLKVVFRNFRKNKGTFLINLLGLSLGISSCVLIFLIIRYETDFDSWHKAADRTYRITVTSHEDSGTEYGSTVVYPLAEAIRTSFPGLENVTQTFRPTDYQFTLGAERWAEENVMFADSSFLNVFDFPLVEGSSSALAHPNRILITQKMAKEHFGNESPVGKTINIIHLVDLEVAGVLADPPANSHMPFSAIVSMGTYRKEFSGGFEYNNWNTTLGFYTYVVLPKEISPANFEKQLVDFAVKNKRADKDKVSEYHLQPLRDIHLNPIYADTNSTYTIDVTYLWILGSTGFFLISLAVVNFINLSTALAIRKSKEVGVRKVLGASRGQLVTHYLGEAFLITVISTLLALGVVELTIPYLNSFLEIHLSLNLLNRPEVIAFILIMLLLVALTSGLYPAWILSGYHPIAALKNKITSAGTTSLFIRKGLVVFQFVISQILVISTFVVASQMDFFRTQPMGFTKDLILSVPLDNNEETKMQAFKNSLQSSPGIVSTAFGIGVPSSQNNINTSFVQEGSDQHYRVLIKTVDFDYQRTFDLELVAGKWFAGEGPNYEGKEFLINEAAVRQMGYNDPAEAIGKVITIGLDEIKAPVVGVLKDFHMQSLREAISPMVMLQFPKLYYEAGIKINPENIPATIEFVKKSWEQAYPDGVFDYTFLDKDLEEYYSREQRIFTMFRIFSAISIFIGCLGLFGLISFVVLQKTKEVGVRKVLGASVGGILVLFSADFVKLLGIAFLVAAPMTWMIMKQWLETFAYKIELSAWYFIFGGLVSLLVALLTIGYQSIKAAIANPVNALRDE